jgi:SAM-dependent methyltransferase
MRFCQGFTRRDIIKVLNKLFRRFGFASPNMGQDILDAATQHRSVDSMTGILGWLLTLAKLEFNDFDLEGGKALEIGTGKFFTHALGLYIAGCSEVVSIDKYRQLHSTAMKLAMSKPVLARRFLSMHVTHDDFTTRYRNLSQTGYELDKLEALNIKYLAPVDLMSSRAFRAQFDLVFSYTVLEHVPADEINRLLKESVGALKPGGTCIHFIDLEDHLDSEKGPFEFLSTDIDWQEDMSFNRGNRLRLSTWQRIFSEYSNMDWRFPYIAIRHDVSLPPLINHTIKYTSEEDLRTTGFVIVGKKLR